MLVYLKMVNVVRKLVSVMCRLSNALNIPIEELNDLELNYKKKRN